MICTQYTDPVLFKQHVLPFLKEHEVENSLLLGVLMSPADDAVPMFMGTAAIRGELSVVLLQTHPRQVIVSKACNKEDVHIQELSGWLHDTYPAVPGFVGEAHVVSSLAEHLARMSGRSARLHMKQRIYKLTSIQKPASGRGTFRKIALEELPRMTEWLYTFGMEANEPMAHEAAAQKAKEFLHRGGLYGLEIEGNLVSVANAACPTDTNCTVNFVYTPKEERRKGYASDCVASLTHLLLDEGYQSTSLYTDVANPTSNKIYMEIGYEPVMDSVVMLLS